LRVTCQYPNLKFFGGRAEPGSGFGFSAGFWHVKCNRGMILAEEMIKAFVATLIGL